MHYLDFKYDALKKHFNVTIRDENTGNEIEIVDYWLMNDGAYEHRERKYSDVMTWREGAEPYVRLECFAAAARLANLQLGKLDDLDFYSQPDIEWLFSDTSRHCTLNAKFLSKLDTMIDFNAVEHTSSYCH